MQQNNKTYDCIIAGGGLASLSIAILLARQKRKVLVIEKKSYPMHKVCGEYISNESVAFLEKLGLKDLLKKATKINELLISDTKGSAINTSLHLGGIGISRYTLDSALSVKAKEEGVEILENTQFENHHYQNEIFTVKASGQYYTALILITATGKYPAGDFYKSEYKKNSTIAVKYHIQFNQPQQRIALHLFKGGYAGISHTDLNAYCLCYLVNAKYLKQSVDIKTMEQKHLMNNPFLYQIFTEGKKLNEQPLVISHIHFETKKPVYKHVLYIGDSAGTIAPLTGNGMSNAFRSAHLLFPILEKYFNNDITRTQLENQYHTIWYKTFKKRIQFSVWVQRLLTVPFLTRILFFVAKRSNKLREIIIAKTHGKSF